jgi:hypothetical protein
MGDSAQRAHTYKDATDFFAAIDNGDLPSVSYVKPDGLIDGHPASSKLDLFEGMVENIYDHLKANPDLVETTAFIITFDEGGGYYDSGYIQPVDFFGDGPRIPLIMVSPFTRPHQPHVCRSRLDSKVHRAELAFETVDQSEPGQFPEPGGYARQSLCPAEQSGTRRSLRLVPLRPTRRSPGCWLSRTKCPVLRFLKGRAL